MAKAIKNDWYSDGSLIINHEYQRQKVWDNIREQGVNENGKSSKKSTTGN